jgi:glycosyltransferase involved in cell wall biosynthesis
MAPPPGAVAVPADGDFAARINEGVRVAPGRDVLLLAPGAMLDTDGLVGLRTALAAADVASVSVLHGGSGATSCARPDHDDAALAAALRAANEGRAVDVPFADGPCILLRGDALAALGPLREWAFGDTMGALADFSVRAGLRGWRHLVATDVFAGGPPFPGDGEPAAVLHAARHGLDVALWASGRRPSSVIFVTHADGGGIERLVQARAAAAQAAGHRAVLIRPGGAHACAVSAAGEADLPDLLFGAADGMPGLAALLRADRPVRVEFHHTAFHPAEIETLPALLGVPYECIVHDYAAICPRVTLCGGSGKYCGAPADPRDCPDCLDDHGARVPDGGDIVAWRARAAALLGGAHRVVAPSADAARRVNRHFAAVQPVVTPWEDEFGVARPGARRQGAARHVVVLGALTRDKGFDVLLACARDAARRALKLRFTLVGHSIGDARLLATGVVFVTGPFAEGEAAALLAEADADLAFLPSVWPETWSFVLSDLWRAGLHVAAFDLGAPAERIRARGCGTVLPAGLPAARINDALLALPIGAGAPSRDASRLAVAGAAAMMRHDV